MKELLTTLSIILVHLAYCQEPAFYVFNEKWESTTVKNGVYLLAVSPMSDTGWQFDTYHMYGPMISSEHYKDKEGKIAHGSFAFYNTKGTRDSIQYFSNGLASGKWYYFNDTGAVYMEKEFIEGRLQQKIPKPKRDSLSEKKQRNDSLERGKLRKDTFPKIEIESEFPGGTKKWIDFLNKNFRYPQRAIDHKVSGKVITQFIIDSTGKMTDLEIIKSVEYSLDQETLRILRKSPKWTPARQNGRLVKSYKRQPIEFRLPN